ncbi:MAG: hypothetical protein ACI4K7_05240, partial [Oscillospiraceae bacterium]
RQGGLWTAAALDHTFELIRRSFPEGSLTRDDGAGENWFTFSNGEGFCMIHAKIRMIFAEHMDLSFVTDADVMQFEGYDSREFSLDPNRIEKLCPELGWGADRNAVDPDCFSMQELYYATI